MRHHGREAAVRRRHGREPAGAAIGVERVALGRLAMVVHEAHGTHHLVGIATVLEVGIALAVRHSDRQAAAGHALKEDAGRFQHFDHRQARLEAVALVGGEARPVLRARDDVGQFGKHLAAVAHAQGEGIATREELLELGGQALVEHDGARPADARAQRVAVAEAAAGHHASKLRQVGTAGLQVGHVYVERLEARLGEGVGHLHMRVHALLAQHRHTRARACGDVRRGHVVQWVERELHVHAGVCGITGRGVLAVSAGGVVALLADLPAHRVPHLVQVRQTGAEHGLGIAPHLQLALARIDGRGQRARLAHEVAASGQAVRAQRLHDLVALAGPHLQHHAQFLVEQRAQRALLAPAADLGAPVLALAAVHAAVGDAVALGDEHVHIQRHAHLTGKGHLGHGSQQAAVAPVVVGEDRSFSAQRVHGVHQGDQVLGVVQVGRLVAGLVQHLPEDGAAHAHLAAAQVDQHEGRVLFLGVELRRERAAHVGQRGERGDDEADGRGDLLGLAALAPLGAHGQAVLAHGDGDAQLRAQLHAHGLHGLVQRGVFSGLAAGRHPVGRQLHARQFDGCRQQVGDAFRHRHAARRGRIERRQRRAFAHGHGLAGKATEVGQRHGRVGHGHLPGAHHLVAVGQAAHGAVADGDEKALGGHRGVGQHLDHGLLQRQAVHVQRREAALHAGHVAVHLGRLAQQHVHGHVHRIFLVAGRDRRVFQHQLALLGGRADHGEGAALALAEGRELRQRLGRDGQHIALLALVGPDFLGRQAGLLQRHGAQVEARAAARVIRQLGEGVRQAARAHVMDGQDGVVRPLRPAVVDDLLRTTLDLGVAALYRVKVQLRRVGARGHGAGGAAAHADAHAGAAQLDQQRAGGEQDFLGEPRVDRAQAARDHDGLVVAADDGALARSDHLLVFAEVARQVGPAELVVERGAAQRPLGHDLQGAGDVLGLAHLAAPELGHGEAREARLGLGAAAGSALVADLAPRTGGGTGERRDGRRVVVRFHLHQNMVGCTTLLIAWSAYLLGERLEFGDELLDLTAFHDGGVVGIGHHGMLGRHGFGVADHAEQALVLRHAVDGELRVEDLVAAVLAVGLGEHHQLHVGGVARQAREGVDQVVDLVVGQGQAPGLVRSLQRRTPALQHVHEGHGLGLQLGEQALRLVQRGDHRFRHAVVQERRNLLQLLGAQLGLATQQAALEADAVFGNALDAAHHQAAVVGDVRGLGRPGRHRAQARSDIQHHAVPRAGVWVAVGQQRGQALTRCGIGCGVASYQVHEARRNAVDLGMNGRQGGLQLLGAEGAEGIAALQRGDVQGHGSGLCGGRKRRFARWLRQPLNGAAAPAARVGGSPLF
ncbi:conserved hypothetical protein [Acidovorax sp. JS42]|nr:conserved hypothetical protein [Acidovorax sp. JS42]